MNIEDSKTGVDYNPASDVGPTTYSRIEQIQEDLYLANQCRALWLAQTKFNWRPKAFYQTLLLGCLDKIYRHPKSHVIPDFRGEVVQKFAWRIGRQSGKSEILGIGALYLGVCKPITEYHKCKANTPGAVLVKPGRDKRVRKSRLTGEYPIGSIKITPKVGNLKPYWVLPYWGKPSKRGAKIIVASADADKVKTVFDRTMKFLNESKEYALAMEQGLITVKKHPFPTITIKVDGWTSPAEIMFRGPGAKGQALRSKTFDYKMYDEADYFPSSFFEAEKATEINAGDDALTILSSTPSGRREHFFKACFVPGTKIITPNGLQSIESLKTGDTVYNRFGTIEPITDTMNKPHDGIVIEIETLGGESFRATPNHKVMSVLKKDRFCKGCRSIVWQNATECVLHGKHGGYTTIKPEYHEVRYLQDGDLLAIPRTIWDGFYKNKNTQFIHKELDFVYVRISQITEIVYQGRVYNLTVGTDHSYNVHGFGVANCTDQERGYKEFWFSSWENPNYTPKLDRDFRITLNQTGYEHEIMADWGTVEQGVFDWTYFQRVFSHKYNNNAKANHYEYRLISLNSQDVKHIGMNGLGAWLSKRFVARNNTSKYWFGADLGFSADPSEFVVFEEFNGVMKMVQRLHLEHLTYDIQSDIIALMDNHFQFELLGMDAGNSGQAVAQILQSKRGGWQKFAHHKFDKRLLPIPFGGRLVVDRRNGKDITEPAKTAMTNMIIAAGEQKLLIMPGLDYDDSVENQFRNHTYSMGVSGQIIYAKGTVSPDHCIDATRTAFFARASSQFVAHRKLPTAGVGRTRFW